MTAIPTGNVHKLLPVDDAPYNRGQYYFSSIAIVSGVLLSVLVVSLFAWAVRIGPGTTLFSTYLILSITLAVSAGLCFLSASRVVKVDFNRPIILIASIFISLTVFAFFVKDIGVIEALIGLLFAMIVALSTMAKNRGNTVVIASIFLSIVIALINIFSPVSQVTIEFIQIVVTALLGALAMVYSVLLLMDIVVATIHVKLITASLAISLIPLLFLSIILNIVTRNMLQKQNFDGLKVAAQQAASRIDLFITNSTNVSKTAASNMTIASYVMLNPEDRGSALQRQSIIDIFKILSDSINSPYLASIGILDKGGMNIYDTQPGMMYKSEATQEYYTKLASATSNSSSSYVSPIIFNTENSQYITFSSAIFNQNNRIIGVVRFHFYVTILQRLVEQNRGLFGFQSSPILLDENYIRLGDAANPSMTYQSVENLTIDRINYFIAFDHIPATYSPMKGAQIPELVKSIKNIKTKPYFTFNDPITSKSSAGYVVRSSTTPWFLVYSQPQDFLTQLTDQQNQLSLLISILIASLVAVAAFIIAQVLANPITQLTATAEKITSGDLSAFAIVATNDEIGTLGNAFNQMTRQVSTLINELEDRVQNRTQELYRQNLSLQYRTQQLQTVSDVARSIASTQDLQSLLERVAITVSDRFNFYHVGIFLVDERGEFAVLRASNSEGGKRMLARQHRLKIGEVGIVGYAAGRGVPRIATDVGADSAFFNNPDLPLTRSEMALPLRFGPQIIGVLDVQSTTANAFSQADIELFGILADQVAIAIMNNRLYTDSNKALAEIQGLHRQYLRMEWTRESSQHEHPTFVYTQTGLETLHTQISPELETVLETARPYIQNGMGADGSATLAIPIILRGEPIGVIQLQEHDIPNREWSPEEMTTVQSVADQIGLALENVRLIEQTTRRAERERKVLEITSKIRATNDLQTMLAVAIEELQKALNTSRAQVIIEGEANQPRNSSTKSGNGHMPGLKSGGKE